jgi:hypothetical protein
VEDGETDAGVVEVWLSIRDVGPEGGAGPDSGFLGRRLSGHSGWPASILPLV